jgi:hypothetical protein
MTPATRKLLLIGVAFFMAIPLVSASGQYPNEAKSTRTTVTVHVVWLPSLQAVNHFCSFLMDRKPPTPPSMIVGCFDPSSDTIYAAEPRSFNDEYRLEILGHEFWHALGAEHP